MIVPPATSVVLTQNRDPPFYLGTTLTLTCAVNYDTQLVDTPVSFNISITGPDTNAVNITNTNQSYVIFRPLLPNHNGTYTCISNIVSNSDSTFISPCRKSRSSYLFLQLTVWGNWETTKIGCHQNATTRQFIKLFKCFSTAQTQRFKSMLKVCRN